MAGLCWMTVTLVLLLSAGDSLADVDQNQLARIVNEVLKKYRPSYEITRGRQRFPMFSLAVSIPYNSESGTFDINQVTDSGDAVKNEILKCEVYTGTRVVAATVLRWPNVLDQCPDGRVQWGDVLEECGQKSMTWADVKNKCQKAKKSVREGRADHAEYRTLQRFDTLIENLKNNPEQGKNDLLLFYVRASPCDKRCTSETSRWSILSSINRILKWKNYAVVFSDVFRPRSGEPIPEEDLRASLERLGKYQGPLGSIGLRNIFRCDAVQCTSCSSGNQVTRYCFSDDSPPQQGRSDSPSQSHQGDRGNENNNINPSAEVSTDINRADGGQGGSGGGKGKRRRGRRKKRKNTNKDDTVSSAQSGLDVHNTNTDSNTGRGKGNLGRKVRKVGGRRVGKKQGRGNKQASNQAQSKKKKQTNKKKKTKSTGTTQQNWKVQEGRAKQQSEKRQKSKQPQTRGKTPRGGEMRRVNQPQKRGKKKRRG